MEDTLSDETKAKEPSCVILDRASLEMVRFAAKDNGRYQHAALNVTPERVEATNRYFVAILKHSGMPAEDFPVVPGDPSAPIPETGTLVPRAIVEKAIKALPKRGSIPILETAKVGANGNGGACVVVTDLENPTILQGKVDAKFPALDKFLPSREDRPIKVVLNAALLKAIADYAIAVNRGRAFVPVRLFIGPEHVEDASRFEIPLSDGRMVEGAIMPMLDTE